MADIDDKIDGINKNTIKLGEYISRDSLKDFSHRVEFLIINSECPPRITLENLLLIKETLAWAEQFIKKIPSVYVPHIVYCKDCEFSDCCSIKEAGCTELYDYCSKGKRKEINNG